MDELIDGAGGTVDDLAATVVRHINIAITSEVPIGSAGIWMLLAIGNFLGNTTSSARDRGLDTPYEAALLTHGLVGALTKAICALNAVIATHSVGPPLLDKLLSLVGQRCLSPLGYHWITEALDAGLLRAITSSTTTKLDNVHGHLPYYLSSVVPNTLVYRSALVRMPKAMNDVQRLVETRAFRKSALYQPWLTFQEIVDDRIKFLSLFASGHYLVRKACDNVLCSQIHEKGNFKRCSGCLEFYYCSLNFQSLDLNSGHRRMCATYRNFRMRDVLDSRDLSFLRELAHVDFRRNLFEILYQIVDIMSLTGEPIMPMMTSMKYTGGKASVQVSPLHMIFPDPRLEDLMTRMHASRGRLALLHITVHEGAARSTRIFRLRFEDARLPDGALSLARSLPPGENARQAALEAGGGINEDTTGHRVLIELFSEVYLSSTLPMPSSYAPKIHQANLKSTYARSAHRAFAVHCHPNTRLASSSSPTYPTQTAPKLEPILATSPLSPFSCHSSRSPTNQRRSPPTSLICVETRRRLDESLGVPSEESTLRGPWNVRGIKTQIRPKVDSTSMSRCPVDGAACKTE
ncbi:hypothetical protein DFH06DRAFT_1173301 [Mycena polygramma]|nr:hypothetical protein DFH06DRAFT_1173301 [Mycena polygramma]